MQANTSEDQKQPFAGLFPLSIKPSFFSRIAGAKEIELGAHEIRIGNGCNAQKIDYGEIQTVQSGKGSLSIILKDGKTLLIPGLDDAPGIAGLLEKLHQEAAEFRDFMTVCEETPVEECWQRINKIIAFRADPYVMGVDAILQLASKHDFSDIHFEPFDELHFKISYRIATSIYSGPLISGELAARLCSRLKYLAGCLSHLSDTPQEGAFNWKNISVRVSSFPADNGERLSVRIISAIRFPDLDSLGWEKQSVSRWREILTAGKGLVLLCGPVGSGKTTAMYASLAEMASQNAGLRVVTIEDPVEAKIHGICQSSLDKMKERDLAVAFKHLLRQDPDVLGLGEIRDSACIREALQAALSGHLVLATFHAGSATEAIDRIRQMGVENYMVLSGLRAIMSLQLVKQDKKLCPVVDLCDSIETICGQGKKKGE